MAASGSVSVALSVTSIVTHRGATPWRRASSTICAGSPRSSRLRAERLTATSSSTPCLCQLARSRYRLLGDGFGQRLDQGRLLDHRDELPGSEQAPLGMLPADQGLDSLHPPAAQLELGLVVEGELAPLQRRADLAEQAQTLGIEVVAPRVSTPPRRRRRHAPAPAPPRRAGSAPGRSRPAGSMWAMPIATSTLTPTPFSTTGASSARWTAPATAAAPPAGSGSDSIANSSFPTRATRWTPSRSPSRRRADSPQELVAGLVSEREVDLLEAFDVGDQDRPAARRASLRQHGVETLAVERAVRQAREPVVAGQAVVLLRLHPQPPRGAGHDPEQHQPQHQQPCRDQQRHLFSVASDRARHGPVAEVHLERPGRASRGSRSAAARRPRSAFPARPHRPSRSAARGSRSPPPAARPRAPPRGRRSVAVCARSGCGRPSRRPCRPRSRS